MVLRNYSGPTGLVIANCFANREGCGRTADYPASAVARQAEAIGTCSAMQK